MAQLDVSEALTDPLLGDTFSVRRRPASLTNKGRSTGVATLIENLFGVFTAASPSQLERLPEEQRMERNFSLVTQFQLLGPATNNQPDTVLWLNGEYLVIDVEPYPQYGEGFVQAIISSTDVIDAAT